MNIENFINTVKMLPPEIAVLLRAGTGVGKSHIVKDLAENHYKLPYIDVRGSTMSEGDAGGYPDIEGMKDTGVMTFCMPSWFVRACQEPVVLFLDELPEYARTVLEVLREPIESGEIRISRANGTLTFPSQFQLLAAMNPCPCGYSGHPTVACSDTPQQIAQYRRKLSGPLLDRFDLHVEVSSQSGSVLLSNAEPAESSLSVYERVALARDKQYQRQGKLNSELKPNELSKVCPLNPEIQKILESAMDRLALSARAAHRVVKVARTLADLEGQDELQLKHITEALAYRGMDRRST